MDGCNSTSCRPVIRARSAVIPGWKSFGGLRPIAEVPAKHPIAAKTKSVPVLRRPSLRLQSVVAMEAKNKKPSVDR
jgi:hypothetical protein